MAFHLIPRKTIILDAVGLSVLGGQAPVLGNGTQDLDKIVIGLTVLWLWPVVPDQPTIAGGITMIIIPDHTTTIRTPYRAFNLIFHKIIILIIFSIYDGSPGLVHSGAIPMSRPS